MKVVVLLAVVLTVVSAKPKHVHPLSDAMIDYINNLNTTWKVCCNHFFVTELICNKIC